MLLICKCFPMEFLLDLMCDFLNLHVTLWRKWKRTNFGIYFKTKLPETPKTMQKIRIKSIISYDNLRNLSLLKKKKKTIDDFMKIIIYSITSKNVQKIRQNRVSKIGKKSFYIRNSCTLLSIRTIIRSSLGLFILN